MDFEFDSGKDRENKRKHGFSLSLGREILENVVHVELDRDCTFEERWIAYGFTGGHLMVCLYIDARAESPHHFGAPGDAAGGAHMAIVKVTKEMVERELASIDWARIDAMTDEDIARAVAEDPDAAPLPSAKMRLMWRIRSPRVPTKYKVRLLRRVLKMTRAEFGEAFGIPERTLQHWEQGTREPDEASLSYLAVIADMPERVRKVHRGAAERRRKAG
jgi:putative transcriptional regulator